MRRATMPTLAWLATLGAYVIVLCYTLDSDQCGADAGSAAVSCVSCRDDTRTDLVLGIRGIPSTVVRMLGINGIPSTMIRFSDRDLSTYDLPLKWEGGGFTMDNDAVIEFASDLLLRYAIHTALPLVLILLLISFACWCCGSFMWRCCFARCCASGCGGCCDKCCARRCFCSKICAACMWRCSGHCSQRYGLARVQKMLRDFWPHLCVTLFVIVTVAMVIVAEVSGNRGITTGSIELAGTADRLARIVHSTAPHAASTLMEAVGVGLVNTLRSVNGTIARELQPNELVDSLSCVDSMVAGLPRGSELLALVQNIEHAIAALPEFVPTRASLVDLSSLLVQLPLSIGELNASLWDIRAALAPFRNLTSMKVAMLNIGNATRVLNSTINATTSDVRAMQAALPPATEIGQTVTDGGQLFALGGRSNPNEALDSVDARKKMAWRIGFKANLTRLKRDIAAVPDPAVLATWLRHLNNSLDGMVSEITASVPKVEMLEEQIAGVPPTVDLRTSIARLDTDIKNISFDKIERIISKMDIGIASFPDIARVDSFVSRFQSAIGEEVCLARLEDRLVHINQTLIWIPAEMDNAKNRIDDLQVDIDKAMNKSTELEKEMDSMRTRIDDLPDLNETDRQIMELRAKSQNSTQNLTVVYADLDKIDASLDIDLVAFSEQSADVKKKISDPSTRPSEFLLDTLTNLSNQLDNLLQKTQRGIDLINQWEMGVCVAADNNGDMCRCDDMNQCSGGSGYSSFMGTSANCTGPGAVCSMQFSAAVLGACTLDLTVLCTSDGDCNANGVCTLPDLSAVISAAEDFRSSSQDLRRSSDDMLDSLADAGDDIDALPNADDKVAEVAKIESEAFDAVVEIVDRIADLADLQVQLGDVPNIPKLISQWDDLQSTLTDLQSGTLTTARESANTLDNAVADYGSMDINTTKSTVRYMNDLVYHELGRYLANISVTELAAAGQRDGLAEMLLVLASVLDALHADMLAKSSLFDEWAAVALKSDIENELPRVRNYQDHDGSRLANGGFSYLYTLLSNSSLADGGASSASQKRTFRGLYDATSGEFTRYADDKVCLSRPCLTNTLKILNTEPLGDALSVIGLDADFSYLPFTRESMFMIALIVPVLVMLFGTVTCICGRVRKYCAWLTVCTTWCGAICILLFVGMIFFPLTMFISDVCYSTENVGFVLLRDNVASICKELRGNLSTSMGGGRCSINPDGLGNETIDIDLFSLYRDVFGKCEGWAVDDAWASAADAIEQHINNEIRLEVDRRAGTPGEIRPLLMAPFLEGAANISQILRSRVGDLGSTVSCDELRHSYYDFKDSVCCGVASAWAVWVVAWYVMSLAMLCCALPAAVTFTRCAQDQEGFKNTEVDPKDDLGDVSAVAARGAPPQEVDKGEEEGDELGVVGSPLGCV